MESIGIAKLKPASGLSMRKALSTRRGAIAVAGIAGLTAFMLLLAFMSSYGDEAVVKPAAVSVLVADQTIEKGTPGDVIAEGKLFRTKKVPESRVAKDAITESASLSGLVTIKDVYPGHKFTMADLAPGNSPVVRRLTGTQRAVALPVDVPHGNIGQVRAGSRVDVFATPKDIDSDSFLLVLKNHGKLVRVLARNALVLKTPPTEAGGLGGGSSEETVVVRLTDEQAARAVLTAEVGSVWILIRPPAIAENSTLPSEKGK